MSTAWLLIPIGYVLWRGWRIAYPCVKVRLEFNAADLWVGVFWKVTPQFDGTVPNGQWVDVWICLLPMLPIHFDWKEKPHAHPRETPGD